MLNMNVGCVIWNKGTMTELSSVSPGLFGWIDDIRLSTLLGADAYSSKGEHDRAIEDYSRAIELDPEYAPAYYNRGNAYSDKGEYDRAIEDLNRAIELDPRMPQPMATGASHILTKASMTSDRGLQSRHRVGPRECLSLLQQGQRILVAKASMTER